MNSNNTCPRCHSPRFHRSHRRGALDRVLFYLGAELQRCHECRYRCASFGSVAIPILDPDASSSPWAGMAVMSSGFVVCLGVMWWVIRRLTELSG